MRARTFLPARVPMLCGLFRPASRPIAGHHAFHISSQIVCVRVHVSFCLWFAVYWSCLHICSHTSLIKIGRACTVCRPMPTETITRYAVSSSIISFIHCNTTDLIKVSRSHSPMIRSYCTRSVVFIVVAVFFCVHPSQCFHKAPSTTNKQIHSQSAYAHTIR